MTDSDTPKADQELFLAMDEDGNMDSGPTQEQAAGRLTQNYEGNLCRIVKVNVHMAPPAIEDQGSFIVDDGPTRTFLIIRNP
jgi:hypothetical protein